MDARFPKSVTMPLEVTTLPLTHNHLAEISCPKCESVLNINQPEPDLPDQLLGSCSDCGAWFAVWINGAEKQAIVVYLAVVDLVRKKLGSR